MLAPRKTNGKSESLLLVILIVLALPAVFLMGIMFGSGTKFSELRDAETLGLWVSSISTVAIAVLTIILAKETWQLRILQINQIEDIRKRAIEPSIEFHLLPSPASFQFMNLQVENNGSGIAKNIRFSFSGESQGNAKNVEKELLKVLLDLNFVAEGVTSISPGERRESYLFSFLELYQKYGDDTLDVRFIVEMDFEDVEGEAYTSKSILDFSEMKGVSQLGGGDPIYAISDELKKIREVLEGARSIHKSKHLNVNVFDSRDRLIEKKRRNQMTRARQNAKKQTDES